MNCELCQTEVMEDERFCPPCYSEIPSQFQCCVCGKNCQKDDNDFGEYQEEEIECLECSLERDADDLRMHHQLEGDADDFFDDEYFEE